jgi:predicted membrane metal-binding protein
MTAAQLEHARAELNRILAQPEFAAARPPNALERFVELIREVIGKWLESLFPVGHLAPIAGTLLFVLILLVALVAVFLLVRNQQRGVLLALKPGAGNMPARSWEQWLASAREAAERGDLRKAIQCSYWAGISRLQESGALPADLTKTPREYLRLLRSPASLVDAMRTLTTQLETFWYGPGEATSADLSTCFRSLEDLGCKVN